MKTFKQLFFIVLSFGLLLYIFGCEREWSNPFDEKSKIDPESWAPHNLAMEDINIISKKLTWSYSGLDNIEGFKIARKEGEAEWQLNYLVVPKDARQVMDTMIVPSSTVSYSYRLFAFAGNNASGNTSIDATSADIPPPSSVAVTKITDASYKITWEDNINGEHGFKIDRKRENEEWEIAYGSVPANHTEFNDENVFSGKSSFDVAYRVYAWCREYESAKVTVNTNISLTPPSNLKIIVNTQTAVTLNWQYTGNSHQGFKIDRREHEGSYWQESFVTLDKTITSYTDTDVNLADNGYTYRVYAYNNTFISAKVEKSVSKPTITTNTVSSVTHESAICGGDVTNEGGLSVTARGLVWSTSQNPTIESNTGITNNGTGAGSFTGNITGLQHSTVYYVRAYATSSAGTAYGIQRQFTTLALPPTVTTTAITNISANSATGGGNVTADGGTTVTARGIVWSTSPNPTTGNNVGMTTNGSGTGSFTSNLTGLSLSTTYYVRAYATNSGGTAYGNQVQFTTISLPTLTTTTISNITGNSATGGGNVTSDGGASVIARGVVWSTSQNPTIVYNMGMSINGSGTGSFTSNLTDLLPGTAYYVRAYATNIGGTAYGIQLLFTTTAILPTVTTAAISNITSNSATGGGNVSADGGSPITARGIAYGTTANPTIEGSTVSSGSGTGSFTANITELTPTTTYHVRAYATNSAGTAYGGNFTFKTRFPCGTNVSFIYNGQQVTYGTVFRDDLCWLDRNLGASRVPTSSTDSQGYGDLFQWGRLDDGHQNRTSSTTAGPISQNVPGHGNFITVNIPPYDWRSPQNNNLWQGEAGINNPCPPGWRLPTAGELNDERLSWSSPPPAGAYASTLKWPAGGSRSENGTLSLVGESGCVWSSSVSGTSALYLTFHSLFIHIRWRAYGLSVRCVRD